MDEPRKTARCIEIARRIENVDTDVLELLGDIYLKEEAYASAAEVYGEIVRSGGEIDVFSALRAAHYLLTNNEPDLASELFALFPNLVEDWPRLTKALHYQLSGEFALAEGNQDAAIEFFNRAILNDPFNGPVLIKLGEVFSERNELDRAYYMFERARRDKDNEYAALVMHAQLLVDKRLYSDALPLIESALEIESSGSLEEFQEQVRKAAALKSN